MRRRINQKAKRTPTQWCYHFNTIVLDPDGWRRDKKSFEDRITQWDFLRRWSRSTAKQSIKAVNTYAAFRKVTSDIVKKAMRTK